mgnify:CR=1 FL=1
MSVRLCHETLASARVETPTYDRAALGTGFVHVGPGAFHRAHQAAYFDAMCRDDPSWGVRWVLPHSDTLREALAPQDNLYTLATLDDAARYRVIGCVVGMAMMRDALDALCEPSVFAVTLTITEKGYCLTPEGGLDFRHPEIAHDVRSPDQPRTALGWLTAALRRRRARSGGGLDIISCDNLAQNGKKLREAVLALAREQNGSLAEWIEAEVAFPCSMVDSITPATDDALRQRVAEAAGVADAWPVQREAFSSWVVDNTASPRVRTLEGVGVVFTDDVAAHEQAKLRLLNGAHSALAYIGLARGVETVADAMRDETLATFIAEMMSAEIAPTLSAPVGLDLTRYQSEILARFRNPAIAHHLAQIAWDGSQKLPIRIGASIADNLEAGRPIARLAAAIAAWMLFVAARAKAGERVTDPQAELLFELGREASGEAARDVPLFLEQTRIAAPSPALCAAIEHGYRSLAQGQLPQPRAQEAFA